MPHAGTQVVEFTRAHILVYICHLQLQLHLHCPGSFFFLFDVNVNFDGGSFQAIKAELKLHLRALLAAGCGVYVCVQRLASAVLLMRGYHGLKWLKCQDFTAPRSSLSTLILAAGEIE